MKFPWERCPLDTRRKVTFLPSRTRRWEQENSKQTDLGPSLFNLIGKQAGFSISLGLHSLRSLLCGMKLLLTRFVCLSPVDPSYLRQFHSQAQKNPKRVKEKVASLHFCVLKPHVLILAQPTTSGELWLFNFSGTHYVQCKIIASMYYDSKSSRPWKEKAQFPHRMLASQIQ